MNAKVILGKNIAYFLRYWSWNLGNGADTVKSNRTSRTRSQPELYFFRWFLQFWVAKNVFQFSPCPVVQGMRSSRLLEQTAVVAAYKWAGCVFWEVWVSRCEKQLWFLEINSPCLEKQWILFQDCTKTYFFVTVYTFIALGSVNLSGAGVLGKLRIKSGECYSTWKLLMKTGGKAVHSKAPRSTWPFFSWDTN